MKKIKKNGFVYIVNIILFSFVFIVESKEKNVLDGILILGLIGSFLFLKQKYDGDHTWGIRGQQISVNALVLLIMFGNLMFLHWEEYVVVEKIYLIIFCAIQLTLVKIKK